MKDTITIQFPIKASPPLNDEKAVSELMENLNTLAKVGAIKSPIDEVLKNYEIDLDTGYSKAIFTKDALFDASKLNTVGASVIHEVPKDHTTPVNLSDFEKTFSAATIQERLRIAKMDPKLRLRFVVMDYKRFYNSKKVEFKKFPDKFRQLKNMFLTDLMGLFNEILPHIEEGKQLGSLIGVSQISPKMTRTARDLSIAYKRALKAEKTSGQINKGMYQSLKTFYGQFLDQLVEVVFPGNSEIQALVGNKSTGQNKNQLEVEGEIEIRKYSYCDDGRISLFSDPVIKIRLPK